MLKFKIVINNQTIEFASEAEAEQYKANNNLTQQIESFTEEIVANSPVPEQVTPRQIRIALVMSDISIETVESFIDNLPEPNKSVAKITWEYSTEIHRNNQLLVELAPSLGLTSEQLDQLFILASGL